jgi:enoyl-CoA hydratase/carnithine racemase
MLLVLSKLMMWHRLHPGASPVRLAGMALPSAVVTRAVEADKLLDETLAFANQLAAIPAVSLKQVKRVFREGLELPLQKALAVEQDGFFKAVRSEETRKLFRSRQQTSPKPE